MSEAAWSLFPTDVGPCAIIWGPAGILGVLLPERDETETRKRLGRRYPDAIEAAPPPVIQGVVARIAALLAGQKVDFADAPLDLTDIPDFHRRVYEVARAIPPGETLTYGDIARQVGTVADARAVGQALGRNPWPIVVPCHRVLAASGRTGGFSAPGGVDTKLRILSIEARHAAAPPSLFPDLPLAARPLRSR